MHMDAEVAPVVGKYLPASQSRHTLMELPPIDAENLPAGQLIHQLDPASEYFPLSHKTHSFEFSVSKGKYDPAAQSMQSRSQSYRGSSLTPPVALARGLRILSRTCG